QAREEGARLLNVTPAEIAFIDDTTMGLNIALAAIPFTPGDNIVLCDLEYPQVALSATHVQQYLGVEVRVVHHRQGLVTIDDYAELIDQRTRLLLVSSVQWINGLRLDLAAFSQLAEQHGCFLVVDAIQQLGALPLDLSGLRVDFLAAGAQKWLNAPFGVGLLYVRQGVQDKVQPGLAHGLFALAEPAQALEAERIYPTVRYCSGVGGLRVSIHYYTSREDLEALLAAMDGIMRKL